MFDGCLLEKKYAKIKNLLDEDIGRSYNPKVLKDFFKEYGACVTVSDKFLEITTTKFEGKSYPSIVVYGFLTTSLNKTSKYYIVHKIDCQKKCIAGFNFK